jgi:hypothetical protein
MPAVYRLKVQLAEVRPCNKGTGCPLWPLRAGASTSLRLAVDCRLSELLAPNRPVKYAFQRQQSGVGFVYLSTRHRPIAVFEHPELIEDIRERLPGQESPDGTVGLRHQRHPEWLRRPIGGNRGRRDARLLHLFSSRVRPCRTGWGDWLLPSIHS